MAFRQAFRHPPFARMLLIRIRGISPEMASSAASTVSKKLRQMASSTVEVSEAAPAPLERSHGQYRYHVVLKSSSGTVLGSLARELSASMKLPEGVVMTLDVDPYSLM